MQPCILGTGQRPQTWADDQRGWASEATNQKLQLDGLTLIDPQSLRDL